MRPTPLAALLVLAGCPPFIWPGTHFDDGSSGVPGDSAGPIFGEDTGRGDTTPNDPSDPDVQDPADDHYDEPWGFMIHFTFAVDFDDNGNRGVVGYHDPQSLTQYPVQGTLVLFDEDDAPICALNVSSGASRWDAMPLTFIGGDTTHTGFVFDVNDGLTEVMNNCSGRLDPNKWGNDLDQLAFYLEPGIGITGEVQSTVAADAFAMYGDSADTWERDFAGRMVGATPYILGAPLATPDGNEHAFARAARLAGSDGETYPSMQWIDEDGDEVWDAGESTDWFTATEIHDAPPQRAVWFVNSSRITTWGRPLIDVFFSP